MISSTISVLELIPGGGKVSLSNRVISEHGQPTQAAVFDGKDKDNLLMQHTFTGQAGDK